MIGEEIKKRREAAGMSQQALAERLCTTQPRVARMEADMQAPSVVQVKAMAQVFGCTTDALIFGEERDGERAGA